LVKLIRKPNLRWNGAVSVRLKLNLKVNRKVDLEILKTSPSAPLMSQHRHRQSRKVRMKGLEISVKVQIRKNLKQILALLKSRRKTKMRSVTLVRNPKPL
jgi:hypothetical protein